MASVVLLTVCISIAGAIEFCIAIERRNRIEARRELFGLSPGKEPWP